jgi:soluble lytic murein transglycosylase-like protein
VRTLSRVLVACGLVLLPAEALAEPFLYKDREGRVHEIEGSAGDSAFRSPAAALPPPLELRAPDMLFPYASLVREACVIYSIPPELALAVIKVESGFNPRAVSRTGAMGLMQLMPQTAALLGVTLPFDPRQNVLAGVRYLRMLVNTFDGDVPLALAAYNAGAGAVRRAGKIPPIPETQRYVPMVLHYYHLFAGKEAPHGLKTSATDPVAP